MIDANLQRQLEVFHQGVDEILPVEELTRKIERSIAEKRPLRIKQGFDPTAPDIHLGHTVGLRKLRDLQKLGHKVVLILGDYTALVGDPSGRSKTRPQLTQDEVDKNAATYLDQFFRVVRREDTEVRRYGEWFAKMSFADILKLTSQYTVARLLERDDFAKRFQANQPIAVHELLYPLMQGWDSVEIQADVEIGGTEQKFNLLLGRALQQVNGQEPQVILTLPILIGLDGTQRMSKSLGNYIGVSEVAAEQFGKLMSIPDELLEHYWRLAADVEPAQADEVVARLGDGSLHPMEAKKQLGERIVSLFHGKEEAKKARKSFEQQFSKRGLPSEAYEWEIPVPEGGSPMGIKDLLVATQLAKSGNEAWRKVSEGAVSIDGNPVKDKQLQVSLVPGEGHLLRLGRRFVRVVGSRGVEQPRRSESPVSLSGVS